MFKIYLSIADCLVEEDIDYYGNDIADKRGIPFESRIECIMFCGEDERCQFWTYNEELKGCWLKTSDSGRRDDRNVTSGTRGCAGIGSIQT